jgi:hypothetical protein
MLAEGYLSDARAAGILERGDLSDAPPGQDRSIRHQAAKRPAAAVPDRPDRPASGSQHGFGRLWQRAIQWARSRSGRRRP